MRRSLFDNIEPVVPESHRDWRPEPLPLIASAGIKHIKADFETNGLRWFYDDRPGGVGLLLPCDPDHPKAFQSLTGTYRTQYVPWGHRTGGGNLDPDVCREWMNTEFKGVRITNISTRFDVHMAREWGSDWEALGCQVSDVGHWASLLDENRLSVSLESLCQDFLPESERKVKAVAGMALDGTKMMDYPAWMVAVRAEADVRQVHLLSEIMEPQLVEQDLMRVRNLEDEVIYVTCEMEKNGSPLNVELLRRWNDECSQEISRILVGLYHETGLKINPNSGDDLEALFNHFKIPIQARTLTGRASFTAEVFKNVKKMPNCPKQILDVIRVRVLMSLKSKYLAADLQKICPNGILRYALHQMRAVKDDTGWGSEGEAGTSTGRYSSTAVDDEVGVNIQQRMKTAKQRVNFGYDEDDASHDHEIYPLRQLHIPADPDWLHLSADAMQIEYRLFAEEVNSPRINAAFAANPRVSFHRFMHAIVKESIPDLTYRRMKDVNFAKIYAAGPSKLALMLGYITREQWMHLVDIKARQSHPLLKEVAEINRVYAREIPETADLIKKCSEIAKTRGFVRSILGRRIRFPDGTRLHKALNSRIQPSAADIMKTKLVELHKARKYTNFILRFTVHDEVDGDIPDTEHAKRVGEVLDSQSFPTRIPILWDVSTGPNWKECG